MAQGGNIMSVTVPQSIDEVTPEWISAATGWEVTHLTTEQIGVGIGVSSAVYRAQLTGQGCPDSIVIKQPALDPAAVFTSSMLRMYIREVRYFTTLAPISPLRGPAYYFGQVDEETSNFILLIEDLSGLRVVDQNLGMTLADAGRAIDAVAALHAKWWGTADQLAAEGTTVSLADPIYPAVLPLVFGEGWEKCTAEMELPASILAIGPRFAPAIEGLLASLAVGPNTLAHGDFRADNMLFTADDEFVALDFQLIGTGTGAYDLAYFITQSLTADDASIGEADLFNRWIDGLRDHGVPANMVDRDLLWSHYRTAALFCLAYPIVASRGMDLSDPRQYGLVDSMNTRFDRAVQELSLADLLP
jgi:hypothetical protein